ncbi:prtrc system protein e [Niabella defluvii]|nr:prtrc system protein e [Niabella sp. I65]
MSNAEMVQKSHSPLTFNATPQEFDEDFSSRLKTCSDYFGRNGRYGSLYEANGNSQTTIRSGKAESRETQKEKEAKDKKYKDGMAKADELEKEGKFREAWIKVPDITEFPEKADEIRKRKSSLSAKFATPDLFVTMGATEEAPTQAEEVTADYPIEETDEAEQY